MADLKLWSILICIIYIPEAQFYAQMAESNAEISSKRITTSSDEDYEKTNTKNENTTVILVKTWRTTRRGRVSNTKAWDILLPYPPGFAPAEIVLTTDSAEERTISRSGHHTDSHSQHFDHKHDVPARNSDTEVDDLTNEDDPMIPKHHEKAIQEVKKDKGYDNSNIEDNWEDYDYEWTFDPEELTTQEVAILKPRNDMKDTNTDFNRRVTSGQLRAKVDITLVTFSVFIIFSSTFLH